jgi:hypothetical protein
MSEGPHDREIIVGQPVWILRDKGVEERGFAPKVALPSGHAPKAVFYNVAFDYCGWLHA